MTFALVLVWLIVAALIVIAPPLRSRRDCWWLALLWPVAVAYAAAILIYEFALYRTVVHLLGLRAKGIEP